MSEHIYFRLYSRKIYGNLTSIDGLNGSGVTGYKKLIIVGTDFLGINKNILKNVFEKLRNYNIIIGPGTDAAIRYVIKYFEKKLIG